MNVTGLDWRDLDQQDARSLPGRRQPRHARQPETPEEEDMVEIHGAVDENTPDGLDVIDQER